MKFNLANAIELSKMAVLCTTLYKNTKQESNFVDAFHQLSFEVFNVTFSEDASLPSMYRSARN